MEAGLPDSYPQPALARWISLQHIFPPPGLAYQSYPPITSQRPLVLLAHQGKHTGALCPAAPSPWLIYMGFTWAHFMPRCTRLPVQLSLS